MQDTSVIRLSKSTVESLDRSKEYPRQSYDELLSHMIEAFEREKEDKDIEEFVMLANAHAAKRLEEEESDV